MYLGDFRQELSTLSYAHTDLNLLLLYFQKFAVEIFADFIHPFSVIRVQYNLQVLCY